MVKHIILWRLKGEFSEEQKLQIKSDAKRELEGLVGKIEGLEKLTVEIEGLSSSNADMMLDSEFCDEASLKAYAKNPIHNGIADRYVRPYTDTRLCLDFAL